MKRLFTLNSILVLLASLATSQAADKKIVFIAGPPSHGPGDHEHRAGCLLLSRCVNQVPGISSVVYSNGWPSDVKAFVGADAVIIYSDGGDGHPAILPERLKVLDDLMTKGVGLGCLHYAVEVPTEKGGAEFLKWIGGYFETFRSVNPTWKADFKVLPQHPITEVSSPNATRPKRSRASSRC